MIVLVSFIQSKQMTVTRDKKETELRARGRHDPCVVPRGKSVGLWSKRNLF